MDLFTFVLYALAVWRLTMLLVYETGPGGLFARLRALAGVQTVQTITAQGQQVAQVATNWLGAALLCFKCTSVWCALFFCLGHLLWPHGMPWLASPLALSAAAILLTNVERR